jgi:hypothetical protein
MVIPDDWLYEPESIEEVEAWLAAEGAPDLWLEEWRRFVDHFGFDDEFWSYHAWVVDDPGSDDWDLANLRSGYARVRDGEAVESISTACPWSC